MVGGTNGFLRMDRLSPSQDRSRRLFRPSHAESESDPSTVRPSRSVVVADPRNFIRGCLSSWLQGFRAEFLTVAVTDVADIATNPVAADATTVLLWADALPQYESWLGQQIAWLREHQPDVAIVLVGEEEHPELPAQRNLPLNLRGYIPTTTSMEVASAALRLILAGGTYFPRPQTPPSSSLIALAPPHGRLQDERPSGTVLTPREQAVFNLLREGLPNKLIAHRLNMSISTVKIHVHHVMQKLRARNRAQVAGLARPPEPSPMIRITGPMNGEHARISASPCQGRH